MSQATAGSAGPGPQPGQVDWDLLADHLGGALAGTAEEALITQLVASDPHWAEAADALTGAWATVATDLRAYPPEPPMPEEVAVRLDAVLAGLPAGAPPTHAVPAGPPSTTRPGGRRPPGRPGAGSRRRKRLRVGVAAAAGLAGVAAFAAVGIGSLGLLPTGPSAGDDAELAVGADGEQPPALANTPRGSDSPRMLVTGTDYAPDAFGLAPPLPERLPEQEATDPETALRGSDVDTFAEGVPDPLGRVHADPQPCLTAVVASHEPAPATVRKVDFARFEGEAALVIWVTTADHAEWVSVAGPDCGTPAAGPDELHRTQVG